MSLTLIITINAVADLLLLAGLAYAMSLSRRLKPHVASLDATQATAEQPLHVAQRRPRTARPSRAHAAAQRASVERTAGAPLAG